MFFLGFFFSTKNFWYFSYQHVTGTDQKRLEKICCRYSLESPHWETSNEYSQHMFLWTNKRNIFLIPMLIGSYSLLRLTLWPHHSTRFCTFNMSCFIVKEWFMYNLSPPKSQTKDVHEGHIGGLKELVSTAKNYI